MLGSCQAVEVAADRTEAIIRADCPVIKILDLLQDRIRTTICEDVAWDEQNRQPIHMRHRGGGNHVGSARADRGGHGMRMAAALGLRIGDRGMSHGLLVLATPGRQRLAYPVQSLADAGHIAVAEDRPDAFDEALAILCHLNRKPAHHGLRRRKFDRRRHATASRASARTLSQIPHSRVKRRAISAIASASLFSPLIQARATSPKIVRPTANPFTSGNFAASAKEVASSPSGASSPSTMMPRVRGSLRSIASTEFRHAASVLTGSSFHQSG